MKNDILTVLVVILFFSLIGSIHLNRKSRKEIKGIRIEYREYRDNHEALQIAFDRCMEEKINLYGIHRETLKKIKK